MIDASLETQAVADYAGRQVDVLAFDAASAGYLPSRVIAQLAGEGGSGKIVTGIQKLVQRFLLELLTEAGSIPYAPERGTYFLEEARMGRFLSHLDVIGAFARAVSIIRENFQLEEKDSDPDDERFGSAELENVEISAGRVRLRIYLTSRAGQQRRIILPIPASLF